MSEWIGVVQTVADKYLKGAADNTVRGRYILSLLAKHNRIGREGAGGKELRWDVEFAEQPMERAEDGGQISFDRSDCYRQLSLDWRGYRIKDMLTGKERAMATSDTALVERYATTIPKLTKAFRNQFSGQLFIDGNATGNTDAIHGLNSFTGYNTGIIAADKIAAPNDSYGGLDTNVGTEGGRWSSNLASASRPSSVLANDWPDGNGDSSYDFMAPKLVNYTASTWGTTSATWEDTCERSLRQSTLWSTCCGGEEGHPTVYLMSNILYGGWLNHMSSKQRIAVPSKEAMDMGFNGVYEQEGVQIQNDFDVPAGEAYGVNIHQMYLTHLSPDLVMREGPSYDIKTDAHLFLVKFWGNARYNPKYFTKLAPYKSA